MARRELGAKALVVAMDHAQGMGVPPGLEDPAATLDKILDGADGIMTSYGVIKHYRDRLIGRIPTFLRLDGGPSVYRGEWLRANEWMLFHSVEDARRLGVDGVCLMGFMGAPVETITYEIVGRVVGECAADGLPVMVEALPCLADKIPDPMDADAMASASRIAFELGADVIKTYYTGSPEGFAKVAEGCPVPVLIAGGVKMDTLDDVLVVVHSAMQSGGRGVVFGRNIWQDPDPTRVMRALRALRAIIHDGASVRDALAA